MRLTRGLGKRPGKPAADSSRRQRAAGRSGRRSESVERLFGYHCVLEALRSGRRVLRRLVVREDLRHAETSLPLLEAAAAAGVPVESIPAAKLAALAGEGSNPQGVLLEAGPIPELSLADLCRNLETPSQLLLLDGVEDPQNLGAITRVAEVAGFGGLILSNRRAPALTPALARASAGAIEWLPVARVANLPRAITSLKGNGFWVLGADPEAAQSVFELADRAFEGDLLVILGAEGRGMRPSISAQVDFPVRIPMRGRIASLNVATAGAILMFEVTRRVSAATAR